MKLVQQTPDTADFDVVFDGDATPAFRVLLPEAIAADGLETICGCHTIPGRWTFDRRLAKGSFLIASGLHIATNIQCREAEIRADLSLRNGSTRSLRDVTATICASVNHLPGAPDWCNRDFIPDAPLDRDAQGRYWFREVAPRRLKALVDEDWVAMHPCPDDPDPDSVPKYFQTVSTRNDVRGCAVASHDGDLPFFQAWAAPCHYAQPFPGNACMHLLPMISSEIPAGETATIRGIVGIFRGDRPALRRNITAELGHP